MRICVVALPGKCLWVKADMVLFAGNIVCIRGISALEAFVKSCYTNRRYLYHDSKNLFENAFTKHCILLIWQ